MDPVDALRSLLEGDDGSDPVRLGAFGATPTAGQSHGSHWEAVAPPERREAVVDGLSRAAVDDGATIEAPPRDDEPVRGFVLGEGPLHTLAVTVGGELATAYPLVQGVVHPFDPTELDRWDGVGAWLSGHLADTALTAFATDHFAAPERYAPDAVAVSGVFYALDPVGAAAVPGDGTAFAGVRPWKRGAPDDHVVQTVVDEVTRVEHHGLAGYRLQAPLFGDPDDGVTAAFHVADHLVEDPPEPGDAVEGPAWLQVRRA